MTRRPNDLSPRDRRRLRILGAAVREAREARRLTTRRLAALAGTTHGNVSRIERGRVPLGVVLLGRLADALEVDPRELLPTFRLAPVAATEDE